MTAITTIEEKSLIENRSYPTVEGDESLIVGLRKGDEASFDALFEKYRQRLFRLSLLYAGDWDAAMDCVQEAFIALLQMRGRLREGESLFPLLAKIAINRCLQSKRADERREARETLSSPSDSERVAGSPEEEFYAGELAEVMRKALNSLPPLRKAVTLLRLETDMTPAEIAQAAGISYLAARLHIHRGMGEIKKAVERYQKGEER